MNFYCGITFNHMIKVSERTTSILFGCIKITANRLEQFSSVQITIAIPFEFISYISNFVYQTN